MEPQSDVFGGCRNKKSMAVKNFLMGGAGFFGHTQKKNIKILWHPEKFSFVLFFCQTTSDGAATSLANYEHLESMTAKCSHNLINLTIQ